uniref:Uncharacterized protein n=1 Tax=Anguilla anguilla TaxID=7936 RepID=A0A0E9SJP2_ANGAN
MKSLLMTQILCSTTFNYAVCLRPKILLVLRCYFLPANAHNKELV